MNFSCDVRDLNRALKAVRRHCSTRAVIPITKCVLIHAKPGDRVSFATTDMTTTAVYSMSVERVSDTGTMAVPLKELSALCGKLRGRVTIGDHDALQVHIINGIDQYYISSFHGDEFPSVVFNDEFETVKVPRDILATAVAQITPIVPKESPKNVLTGIWVNLADDRLTMVGCDERRLAVFQTDTPGAGTSEVIILPDTLASCIDVAERQDDIEIGLSSRRLKVSVPGFEIYTQKIEGQYVDWTKVVPDVFDRTFAVNREDLIDLIDRCILFAQEEKSPGFIHCKFGADGLHMKAMTAGLGQAEGSVAGDYDGAPLEIGWNGNYILDALRVIEGEEVVWQMRGPTSSGVITDKDHPLRYRYTVMPVKLREDSK